MCKIGVIIVTFNAMKWIDQCMAAFKSSGHSVKVYIIDNGSKDGTQEYIKNYYPHYEFYQCGKNIGFGKANNIGFEVALRDGCSHFLLLNQDAMINLKEVEKLADIQNKNNNYGILSPIHMNSNNNLDQLHLKTIIRNGNKLVNDLIIGRTLEEIYEIKYTNAAMWLISKECLKKVGGFDPLFPHYGEDLEYAQRVNYFGFKVGVCPNIRGVHFRNQNERRRDKNYYFNNYLVQLKNLNQNLNLTFLRLFKNILFDLVLLKSDAFRKITAFFKIIWIRKQIILHRRQSLFKDFSFINYE